MLAGMVRAEALFFLDPSSNQHQLKPWHNLLLGMEKSNGWLPVGAFATVLVSIISEHPARVNTKGISAFPQLAAVSSSLGATYYYMV